MQLCPPLTMHARSCNDQSDDVLQTLDVANAVPRADVLVRGTVAASRPATGSSGSLDLYTDFVRLRDPAPLAPLALLPGSDPMIQ